MYRVISDGNPSRIYPRSETTTKRKSEPTTSTPTATSKASLSTKTTSQKSYQKQPIVVTFIFLLSGLDRETVQDVRHVLGDRDHQVVRLLVALPRKVQPDALTDDGRIPPQARDDPLEDEG
jgi:hypothetical protein